jgi:hypothetical protein
VVTVTSTISTFIPKSWKTDIEGLSFKQFSRTYPGNLNLNFVLGLSSTIDFKTKNYSNFYLTDKFKFSDVFYYDISKFKTDTIYGPISIGSEFLKFDGIDYKKYTITGKFLANRDYGSPTFTSEESEDTDFSLILKDNNKCCLFFTKDNTRFYLSLTNDNLLFFVNETELSFDENSINPQDFEYLYSETSNYISFLKKTPQGYSFLSKVGNELTILPLTVKSINNLLSNPFKISKNIYSYPNVSLDTTFVTYNDDNTINLDKSEIDLKNNYLLHNVFSELESNSNIIVLKNQLLQNDRFSSSNNLLSSQMYNSYVDDLRSYTCIGEDIKEEESDDLSLNYIFYNKPYLIKSGTNMFTSPSSMYPFENLNVNDTKFVESGSYSSVTPEYADKIYFISDEPQLKDNGQYLLCTWLSGSPFSEEKIWVDRYYYPDYIDKKSAFSKAPITNVTYDNYIEKLVESNSGIRNSLFNNMVFDKMSDLSFKPNQTYVYERIQRREINEEVNEINFCSTTISLKPSNYFRTINEKGELTISFNFKGDSDNWILESDRSEINAGVSFEKKGSEMTFTIRLYDSSNFDYQDIFIEESISSSFKSLKNNFTCISIDTKTGDGYFFLNNVIVKKFKIPSYEFYIKQILLGDFVFKYGDEKINVFLEKNYISNLEITPEYTDPDIAFSLDVGSSSSEINDLVITLPCGMRNSLDNIQILNSICGSSTFKSNNVNIYIKNLSISNNDILNDLKQSLKSNIEPYIPSNTNINNVEFLNFK